MQKKILLLFLLFFHFKEAAYGNGSSFEYEECYLEKNNWWDEFFLNSSFLHVEIGLGFRNFYDFPKISYGFMGPVAFPFPENFNQPYSDFTASDKPQAPYAELGISFILPSGITPGFLGSDIQLSLKGIPYFEDQINRNTPLFTDSDIALPNIEGQQISILDLGFIGVSTGPGFFNRSYFYSEFNFSADLKYDLFFLKVPFRLEPFAEIGFNQLGQRFSWRTQNLRVFIGSITNVYQLQETLTTKYIDFGGGVKLIVPLRDVFLIDVRAGFYGSHAHTHFWGSRRVSSDGGTFSLSQVSLSKDDMNTKFKGSAGIHYLFRNQTVFSLIGKYEYWGFIAAVRNPQINSTGTVIVNPLHIGSETSSNYSLEGKVGFYY